MAYSSFRIRRQDNIAAPDANPFGSYVRGTDETAPDGLTRTDSDSALRSSGVVLATGSMFVEASFSAIAIDYSAIELSWSSFLLINPIDNESGDSNSYEVIVVYSSTGFPETVADGVIIKTQKYDDEVSAVTHNNLPEGRWAYYSLFLRWNQNGTGPSGVSWYERVATLQELVPKNYGGFTRLWNRIPNYIKSGDTSGRSLDPTGQNRGQLERFINVFGFELDKTQTLINAVVTQYDPSLTESESLDELSKMLGLEITSQDIGISRIRQIIQDIGYYRQRKGTLDAAAQYITAISGSQVDIIESTTDPRYTFRVYAEKANLVADSLFVIESGTKKWDFSSSSASCTYTKANEILTVSNTSGASAQFALTSTVAVPVQEDTDYWSSVKKSGDGRAYGSFWSASAAWTEWDTEEQDLFVMPTNLSPENRTVILMPESASAMAYPVMLFALDDGDVMNVSEWMVEPKTYGTFFNGSSDFGGFIYQNNFADHAWSDQEYASYSTYTTNKKKTQDAITKLLPTLIPVTILIQDLEGYALEFDWIPGKT
jgi:hypothetical protein